MRAVSEVSATALGNALAHKLFDRVAVDQRKDAAKPARAFADYEVQIDRERKPQGIEVIEML